MDPLGECSEGVLEDRKVWTDRSLEGAVPGESRPFLVPTTATLCRGMLNKLAWSWTRSSCVVCHRLPELQGGEEDVASAAFKHFCHA